MDFPIRRTVGQELVKIFTEQAGGDRPIIGAYYSGGAWIPTTWTKQGKFRVGKKHPLDLVPENLLKDAS